jgi:hypothetical protein
MLVTKRGGSLIFIFMLAVLAFAACIIWQLWLAETKGKIWARTRFATRDEPAFAANVALCWVLLGMLAVMFYVSIIAALKGDV